MFSPAILIAILAPTFHRKVGSVNDGTEHKLERLVPRLRSLIVNFWRMTNRAEALLTKRLGPFRYLAFHAFASLQSP